MTRTGLAAGMIAFALAFCGCSDRKLRKFSDSRPLMGTLVSIVVYAEDGEKAAAAMNAAFDRIVELEALLSNYRPDSDISRFNSSPSGKVKVAPETFVVLAKAVEFGRLSGGAFDITVEPLLKLWGTALKKGVLPEPAALRAALRLVDYRNLELDAAASSVGARKKGVRIDVGGIAKGFIVAQAVAALRSSGVSHALVTAGGDMYALGANPEHGRWIIGIRDPLKPDENIRYLEAADRAVATSAHYMRFYTVKGKRYSHIVDPATGRPVENMVASVTIVGPEGTACDALSTSVAVLGMEKGLALVRSMPGIEALVMTWEAGVMEFHQTPGFGRYLMPPKAG